MIVIYLLGVVAAFLLSRYFRRKIDEDNSEGWGLIMMFGMFSFLSWILVIFLVIVFIQNLKIPKPPKWL